jgi:hypothetical protein
MVIAIYLDQPPLDLRTAPSIYAILAVYYLFEPIPLDSGEDRT